MAIASAARRNAAGRRPGTPHTAPPASRRRPLAIVPARPRTCWRVRCSSPRTSSNPDRTIGEPSLIFSYEYRMVAISVSFARKKKPASATANRASRTTPTRRAYFSHRRMPIVAASNPATIAKTAARRTSVNQSSPSLSAGQMEQFASPFVPGRLPGERLGQGDRGAAVDRFPESEGRFEVERAGPQLGILGRLEDLANFGVNLAPLAEHGERGPALGQVMGHARIVGVRRPQFADECGDPAVNSPHFIRHACGRRSISDRVHDRDLIDLRELVREATRSGPTAEDSRPMCS